jgi:hypothetical protein
MTEVWLQSNRRVLALGLVPAAGLIGLGAAAISVGDAMVLGLVGWALIAVGALLALVLLQQSRRPRIAYSDGEVLFNLRAGPPIAVPHKVVEAFFLGQGPAYLPRTHGRDAETVNLVARLSQKAPEWMHVDVKPALGHWCEGYVTIRGTWCEPLSGDVIRRLNARLRELRTVETAEAAPMEQNPVEQDHGKQSHEPSPRGGGDA